MREEEGTPLGTPVAHTGVTLTPLATCSPQGHPSRGSPQKNNLMQSNGICSVPPSPRLPSQLALLKGFGSQM